MPNGYKPANERKRNIFNFIVVRISEIMMKSFYCCALKMSTI